VKRARASASYSAAVAEANECSANYDSEQPKESGVAVARERSFQCLKGLSKTTAFPMRSSIFLLAALSAVNALQIPLQVQKESLVNRLSDGLAIAEQGNSLLS